MDTGLQLLLVEDDPVTCEVLSLMLASDGWQVATAESGEAALAHVQAAVALPTLLLCDQKLPGLSGAPLAEALRSAYRQKENTSLVLLAMSASRGAVPDGYDALLLKPFSAKEVREAFETSLRGTQVKEASTSNTVQSAEVASTVPVLDEATFRNLRKNMGDERVRELYAFAIADAADRIRRMQAAVNSKDASEMAREAHMLKGAAGMVGARRLAELAAHFESPIVDHSETGALSSAKMAMLTAALDDIERMLETQLPAQT